MNSHRSSNGMISNVCTLQYAMSSTPSEVRFVPSIVSEHPYDDSKYPTAYYVADSFQTALESFMFVSPGQVLLDLQVQQIA